MGDKRTGGEIEVGHQHFEAFNFHVHRATNLSTADGKSIDVNKYTVFCKVNYGQSRELKSNRNKSGILDYKFQSVITGSDPYMTIRVSCAEC